MRNVNFLKVWIKEDLKPMSMRQQPNDTNDQNISSEDNLVSSTQIRYLYNVISF